MRHSIYVLFAYDKRIALRTFNLIASTQVNILSVLTFLLYYYASCIIFFISRSIDTTRGLSGLKPIAAQLRCESHYKNNRTMYRSGTVNSKSFVAKVLLRIKWKFELIYAL